MCNMNFFSSKSILKELLLLQYIEQKPNTTQKEIAKVIDGVPLWLMKMTLPF